MRPYAFTVLELIVSILVICIVAAITYPALLFVKTSALHRRSISDMRQIAVSTAIYREHWSSIDYGDMESMGLPQDYRLLFATNISQRNGPWPIPPMHPGDFAGYYYMPLPRSQDGRDLTWEAAVMLSRDATLLVSDPWLNNGKGGTWHVYDPSSRNEIYGISLGGWQLRKKAYGDFIDFSRWR